VGAMDNRSVLVTRIECPTRIIESFDAWIPKHFDDSLDHDSVTSATNYQVIRDFDSSTGLPWVLNGHGNRLVVYVADSTTGLIDWLDSPELRGAVKDGLEFLEGKCPSLDGEVAWMTGNIYEVRKIVRPVGQDFLGSSSVFVERFEVGIERESEFVDWLEGKHLAALSSISDVTRVRTFRQKLDVPQRFPYDRYCSKGNYMIMVEIPSHIDLRSFARRPAFLEIIQQSLIWDLELSYVRRELVKFVAIRNKSDAKRTFFERHK